MPPFILAPALQNGARPLPLRGSCRPVFGCEDDIAALARYFLLGISGQSLRTGIPADDMSGAVLGEHREVGRAFEYETQQVRIVRGRLTCNSVCHQQLRIGLPHDLTPSAEQGSKRTTAQAVSTPAHAALRT